jgi:hypothetical protein
MRVCPNSFESGAVCESKMRWSADCIAAPVAVSDSSFDRFDRTKSGTRSLASSVVGSVEAQQPIL